MPTREQLVPLAEAGVSYEQLGERFGIPPGQAYLIVTGLPADGSDVLGPEYLDARTGVLPGGSQHLANPPTEVVTRKPGIEDWVKARVGADAPLRAVAAQRTAEPPPIEDPDATDDVIDLIGRDHNRVKYLQEQLEAIPDNSSGGTAEHRQRRVSIVDMMRLRLSPHETAEEEVLWPAVREHLPDGDELAQRAEEQEQEGKDLLQALDGMPGDDEEFDELVQKLDAALRKHVAFEDSVLLRLRGAVPDEQRSELGRRFRRAEEHGPTRPHPHAPAGSQLAAAAAAPLDRARDAAGNRPAKREGQPEQPPAFDPAGDDQPPNTDE